MLCGTDAASDCWALRHQSVRPWQFARRTSYCTSAARETAAEDLERWLHVCSRHCRVNPLPQRRSCILSAVAGGGPMLTMAELRSAPRHSSVHAISLGRRNYLCAGADSGSKRAAAMYELIGTAKLNAIALEA